MNARTIPLLLTLLPVLPQAASAQEADVPTQPSNVVSMEELQLEHYVPKNVDPKELFKLVQRMVGRDLYIEERVGSRGRGVENLAQLGDSLVLYDTLEYLALIRRTLEALDVSSTAESAGEPVVTRNYTLRHIGTVDAERALAPFARLSASGRNNIQSVEDRRVLVLRDTASRVREMEALLAELDVSEEQVFVRVQLVRGQPAKDGAREDEGVEEELARELRRLLPGFRFRSVGFSMLRSAAAPRMHVKLGLEGADGGRFEIAFRPVAYDPANGDLTVEECALAGFVWTPDPGLEEGGSWRSQQVFSTNTVFRGGEYTVLGASGADPIFVVVRVSPVR